jgi:hypothetical protein
MVEDDGSVVLRCLWGSPDRETPRAPQPLLRVGKVGAAMFSEKDIVLGAVKFEEPSAT